MGRNAGGNFLRPFVSMESDHSPPDASSKSLSLEAGSQADEGPESARWGWLFDDHEGDRTSVHATFQHALSRMMKGVPGPSAVAPIADLRAHLRINMEPPAGKDLTGKSRNLLQIFQIGLTDVDFPIGRKSVKPDKYGR